MPAEDFTIRGMLGPLFIAMVVTSCLYGATSLQTYIYFTRGSAADNAFFKYLVFFLWIVNTLRLAVISDAAYTYLVTDFTNSAAILELTWTFFPATLVIVSTNTALVRGIFCYRIWRLSGKNMLLAMAISLVSLMSLGTTVAYAVLAHRMPTWGSLAEFRWLLAFCFALSVVADIFIGVALCALLAMRKTGYARSDTIVQKLILCAVNNGLISTMCAVSCLATYLTMPDNLVFMGLYIIHPELVLSSLLATLNGRSSLQLHGTSASAVQHAAFDSARTHQIVHKMNDVNLFELGAVRHSGAQESDISAITGPRMHSNEGDKMPALYA